MHGLIHFLGFAKAFGISEVKGLSLPISKPVGVVWLLASILLSIYPILNYFNNQYAWLFGFIASILSQTLIIYFWSDAKYGTLLNLIILGVVACSFGSARFQTLVEKEKNKILSIQEVETTEMFTESEIEDLPQAVKSWLINSGAIGKAKTQNGKVIQKAQLKMKPEQEDWYIAKALQYSTINNPSFLWTINLKMNSLMWFKGRDKFQNGKGEMLIKMNSIINVVNESGKKIDEGSLQRFLGEMVWFPSLAVSPYVSWKEIDQLTAEATINYKNTSGSGTFYFDKSGDFIRYEAMRFHGNEPNSERKKWILTVDNYQVFDGIKIPSKMKASWKLDNGFWTWLKLEIVEIEYNLSTSNHR